MDGNGKKQQKKVFHPELRETTVPFYVVELRTYELC